jgi:hypothetical protein
MAVTNTLAYYDTATITAVKRFVVQATAKTSYKWANNKFDGPKQGILNGDISLYHRPPV